MVKFGTGGWRAIIGEEFTKENIQKLTLAMCLKMKAEHKDTKSVVIGYDRRFLSKEAVIWACQILGKEGIHVQFVNRSAPTPLLMFYVMKHELDYGMMVTASHNPAIPTKEMGPANATMHAESTLDNTTSRIRNVRMFTPRFCAYVSPSW